MTTNRIELIGGFESTFLPGHDLDVAETTGHVEQRDLDLTLLRVCGIDRSRYPLRWHRIEAEPGVYDWADADRSMDSLRDHGVRPIVDLVHHTSYPAWLTGGFADERFAAAYLRFVAEAVDRYAWVDEWTPFNEPFSTLFLCGHEAIWPPYHRGRDAFVAMLVNVLPAVAEATRVIRRAIPGARIVHVDACERHTGESESGSAFARYANDRRFFVLDALLGELGDVTERPFAAEVLRHGGAALADMEPGVVDVVGLDYYAHCQWHFDDSGARPLTPHPPPLADVIADYATHHGRPVMLSETNLRGHPTDRVTWFKYVLEQCERAVAAGVDLDGLCWFPFVDSCDWDSLLFRCDRNVDPVGVFGIGPDGRRHPSAMSVAYARVGHGATSADLPAYVLQPPVSGWLAGYREQMAHWTWSEPPQRELRGVRPGDDEYAPLSIRDVA